jgi:hypothetical protein
MNLTFGKSLSLTTMAKVVVFPLLDVFIPNSPMPTLDICDWLLFVISTTVAGISFSLCLFAALLIDPLDAMTGSSMDSSGRFPPAIVVCVVFVIFSFL